MNAGYFAVPREGYSGIPVEEEPGIQEMLKETPLDEAGAPNSQAGGRRRRPTHRRRKHRRATRRHQRKRR